MIRIPKPLCPRPNPKRLPKRKAVTIAIGFVANDGIAICADTQQTIGNLKTYDGKVDLHIFHEPRIAMIIAGAGNHDYIKTATDVMLEDWPGCANLKEVRATFKQRLLSFFDDHLAKWAYFPEAERPTVELLIGVSGKNIPMTLFHYEGTSFHRTYTRAIGNGVLLADEMIHKYCHADYKLAQLSSIGVFILSKVKHGVDGCGGSTHILALRKSGDFALTNDKEIKEMEESFLEVEKSTDKTLVDAVSGKPLFLSWHSESSRRKRIEND
jgi:20S proteasome alpha/beta subunit